MHVYFSDDELRAVKRSLSAHIELYSNAVKNALGPMNHEYTWQKLRARQRHLAALKKALRRLTPSGGASGGAISS